VPVGAEIPLVMQVGKWRRQVKVKVDACVKNDFNKKDANGQEEVLRLPRSQAEGSLPQIAVSTGSADPLVCLLPRLGVEASEFTGPTGTGRVHIYQGNGGNVPGVTGNKSNETLWDSAAHLAKYDVVLLSCEGGEGNDTKSAAQKVLMRDYLNSGGRAFATHYHYTWFKNGPTDVASVANWTTPLAGNDDEAATSFAVNTDPGFPKGVAFGEWLKNVGASTNGKDISLVEVAISIATSNPATSQEWVYNGGGLLNGSRTKYMSFNTPIGTKAEDQCGKAVLSDIHIAKGTSDSAIPTSCGTSALTAQEKALLFLLMDLSSCVQNDKLPPPIPK
jgi:hypothetical protein